MKTVAISISTAIVGLSLIYFSLGPVIVTALRTVGKLLAGQ